MKKSYLVALLAVVQLFTSVSMATLYYVGRDQINSHAAAGNGSDIKASEYEIIEEEGQKLVLIKTQTAQQILDILISNDEQNVKIDSIKTLVANLGQLKTGEETFCSVAGEVYQNENKNAEKMALQCQKRLAKTDMLDELPEEVVDVDQIRALYSKMLAIVITF